MYYRFCFTISDWLKDSDVSLDENEVSNSGPGFNSTPPHLKISNDKIIISSKTVK